MKHLLLSILCLIMLLLPWLSYESYSNNHISKYNTLISQEIMPSIRSNNWTIAEENYNIIIKDWQSFKNTSEYFLDSESINEVDALIDMTANYIKLQDSANSSAYISKLSHMLKHLHETEKLSTDNIL